MPDTIASLTARWRDEATLLRRRGAEAQAALLESCADDLEAANREADLEALTLQEAAQESGYSVDHLGRLVREGRIPNAGQGWGPRIRRCDLPRKPFQEPDSGIEALTARLLRPGK
jgi:hypothetical protein